MSFAPANPTYRRFKAFYADYWGVSPSTLFKVAYWSNTYESAWLEMGGQIKCVPVMCLVHNRSGWRSVVPVRWNKHGTS